MELPSITMFELPLEKAMDAVGELDQVTRNISDGMEVYSGVHERFGAVHIIIPATGESVVLPLVVQDLGV